VERKYEWSSILSADGSGVAYSCGVPVLYEFCVKPVLRRFEERWRTRQLGPLAEEDEVTEEMRGGDGGVSIRVLMSIRSSDGAPRKTILFPILFLGICDEEKVLSASGDDGVW